MEGCRRGGGWLCEMETEDVREFMVESVVGLGYRWYHVRVWVFVKRLLDIEDCNGCQLIGKRLARATRESKICCVAIRRTEEIPHIAKPHIAIFSTCQPWCAVSMVGLSGM